MGLAGRCGVACHRRACWCSRRCSGGQSRAVNRWHGAAPMNPGAAGERRSRTKLEPGRGSSGGRVPRSVGCRRPRSVAAGVARGSELVCECRLMFTLRCTKKLLTRMKVRPDLRPPLSTTKLGDWYADVLNLGRERLVLCVSELTLRTTSNSWFVTSGTSCQTRRSSTLGLRGKHLEHLAHRQRGHERP